MTDQQLEIILKEETEEQVRFGRGWYSLVKDLYKELLHSGWDGKFTCAKQKYGHLAFYLENRTPALVAIVEKYQRLSALTCEDCGLPGRTMDMGWLKTVCPGHYLVWSFGIQKEYMNYRGLGTCEICGFVSVLNNECLCCHNEQWTPSRHTDTWTKEERIKTYQLDWYSYIKGIADEQISPFPKAGNHRLYFNSDELDSYEHYTEYDF